MPIIICLYIILMVIAISIQFSVWKTIISITSLGELPFLHSMSSSYMHVFAMHLREPLPREPKTNSSRLSIAFLWLYVMVISISYSSNLTAFLTIARQPRSIDTFKDLLESELPVVGLGPIFGNLMKTSVNVYLKVRYVR